jgi:hypothetical protein
VAEYSADLLPHLARLVPTTAFTSEPGWAPDRPVPGLSVRPHTELAGALRDDPGLVPVHHVACNPHHRFVHDLASRMPGVLVLHDVGLHADLLDRAAADDDWGPYREALTEQYGPGSDDLVRMRREGLGGRLEQDLLPLSGPLVRRSVVTVVHSHHAGELARQECPTGIFHVVAHHAGMPPAAVPLTPGQVRRRLGVSASALLAGCFGAAGGEVLLRALAQLTSERVETAVVFVGAEGQREALAARAGELGVAAQVCFADAATRPERYAHLAALDAVVSLPHPSAGDTSGMVQRAMSAGKCVVVGDCANLAELPADACVHVPVDDDAVPGLARALRRLAERPSLRRVLGDRAVRHATVELRPHRCARRYAEVAAAARYLADAGLPVKPGALTTA